MKKIFFISVSILLFQPYCFSAEIAINAKNCDNLQPRPGYVTDTKGNAIITFYCKANESIRKLAPIKSRSKDYKIVLTKDGYVDITLTKSSITPLERNGLYSQFNGAGFKAGSSAVSCEFVSSDAIKYNGQIYLKSSMQPVLDQGVGLESGGIK